MSGADPTRQQQHHRHLALKAALAGDEPTLEWFRAQFARRTPASFDRVEWILDNEPAAIADAHCRGLV